MKKPLLRQAGATAEPSIDPSRGSRKRIPGDGKYVKTRDPELSTMIRIEQAMRHLDSAARSRVLTWVNDIVREEKPDA